MSKDVRLLAYKVCLTGLMAVASGIGPRATAAAGAAAAPEAPNPIERMWYQRLAADWNEAVPLGNGRLGAMVFGGTGRERLQLNEETIWTREPDQEKNYRCDGPKALQEIRRLTLEGRWSEAQALFGKAMVDRWRAKYQPMCDLWLEFPAAGLPARALPRRRDRDHDL